METLASWVWLLLGWGVYPVWLASGVLDYACHRRDRIEVRSGRVEPLLHLAQALQIGIATLVVLLLELSPAVLLMSGAAVVLHSLTAYADIAWAAARRVIGPLEQFAHTLLVGLPLVAFVLLLVIAMTQVDGGGDSLPGFRLRQPPLPVAAIVAVVAGGLLIGVFPAVLEWLRARRLAGRRGATRE